MTPTLTTLRAAALVAAGLALGACSHSSGGASAPPPPPVTPQPLPLGATFLTRFAPVTQIRVLLLNIDYSDDSEPPIALDKIDAAIAGFKQRIATDSFGITTALVDVVDVVMPRGIAYYRGKDFAIRVRHDALHAAGYGTAVPAGYDRLAFLGPAVWPGTFVGLYHAFGAYMSVADDVLFEHEILHTYDKLHANAFDPAAANPNAGNVEYGDMADPMGEVWTTNTVRAHKGMHGKTRRDMGWLPPERFLRIDPTAAGSSGNYTLSALESGTGLLGIEVPTGTPGRSYWIQYRGNQAPLQGPVVTEVSVAVPATTRLLDPTPGFTATGWTDAFIALGVPFTAPEGLTVETLHVDEGVSATVRVTLPPSMPSTTDRVPVIGFSLPSAPTDVFSGQAKFRATAYDADDGTIVQGAAPTDFVGIQSMRYTVVSDDDGAPPLADWTTSDPAAEFALDTTKLPDGHYVMYVQATPKTGLGASSTILLNFMVDNAP